jgi:hypothetical protein
MFTRVIEGGGNYRCALYYLDFMLYLLLQEVIFELWVAVGL